MEDFPLPLPPLRVSKASTLNQTQSLHQCDAVTFVDAQVQPVQDLDVWSRGVGELHTPKLD